VRTLLGLPVTGAPVLGVSAAALLLTVLGGMFVMAGRRRGRR
jgi:hypothetical protein